MGLFLAFVPLRKIVASYSGPIFFLYQGLRVHEQLKVCFLTHPSSVYDTCIMLGEVVLEYLKSPIFPILSILLKM